MANIPCPITPVACDNIGLGGDAIPNANYSSETPDAVSFFGRNYGPGNNPPLGTSWVAATCVGTCVSLISQAEADACAARANISCLATDWPVTEPNPDPNGDPFINVPRPTFLNEPQTCSVACPDGSMFSYTVPAGTVEAFSLAAANASAHSIACNRASEGRICIGSPEVSSGCVGDQFVTTVEFTALKPPVVVELFNLPAGLSYTFTNSFVTILGIPETGGEYLVTIHITDDFGGVMDKVITLGFAEIFPDTLADGEVGEVYSQALSVVGPTVGTVVWSVSSGTLPTGLTLNTSTGEISGTPTAEGTFNFTIRMSDDQ